MAVHAQTNYTLTTKPAKTSLLGGHFIYRVDTTQGTLTPSSANIIQNAADSPQQWGYNTHIGANGIKLRYNETTLSEWKADHLTFYKPGTNNPSLELINGVNTALNIYNPTNNTKTLGLDISGLNFYGTSISVPDVTLNANGLTLINGSIRGGIVGQDEFLYLSPQVFADEYEEYVLSEDTEVNETKIYYIRSGEEGEYIYTEVSEPTGNPQENEYYEIAHVPGTIPIDDYVKDNWRQIIGRKFAVDTDGNLYANGLNANNAHLQQAEVEGAIVATSLTIGSGSDAYDGTAAINISGYDIEIERNGIDEIEGVSVYLYPILYHNGDKVEEYILSTDMVVDESKTYYLRYQNASGYFYEVVENPIGNPSVNFYYEEQIHYDHFIWYQDNIEPGTAGDANNKGRYLATYGHNYRVTYDFDDGAVGGGAEIQTRTVDPSKYITKINDTGITIHPEVWTGEANHIQLDGNGMELFDNNNNSIAKYGNIIRIGKDTENHLEINNYGVNILNNTNSLANFGNTARIGLSNSSRFLMNSNSLEAYDNNNNKYFEVNSNGLSWGNNTAATTDDLIDAAKTATNYITTIDNGGIKVHDEEDEDNYAKIDSNGLSVYKHETNIAVFGENTRIGKLNDASKVVLSPDSIAMYDANNINVFSSEIPEIAEEGSSNVIVELEGITFESTSPHPAHESSSSTGYYSGYDISELDNVVINENFTLDFWVRASFGKPIDSSLWDVGFEEQAYVSLEFTKGVSKTYTNIVLRFNQNDNLSGSSTLTMNNISYNATTGIINCGGYVFFNDTNLVAYSRIQITTIKYVHHNIKYPLTTIKGDCCLNGDAIGNSSILGQCFINPNTKLSSLIQTLGWDYGEDSVVISVSLYNSSYSVGSNEPAYVSAHIEPYDSTNPVIWTSSNEDIFTVRKKGYVGSGGSLIYNYITAVGNVGDIATLTCWINCGGALVKDSATVTITETTPQLPDE